MTTLLDTIKLDYSNKLIIAPETDGYGDLDELQLYNRALTSSEIITLASALGPMTFTGIIGHWSFDENANDVSGNGNPAYLPILITDMEFSPDGRLFFTEKDTGNVRIMVNNSILQQPFLTIQVNGRNEQGPLGLTLDPEFGINHFVYVFYSHIDKITGLMSARVTRATDVSNEGQNIRTLLEIPVSCNYHKGRSIDFAPDDTLFITTGDDCQPKRSPDPKALTGKVLRINRDGSIPLNNPVSGSPIYTIGHRNVFGIAFNGNGTGLITDNDNIYFDEINLIQKGGDYGWPYLQQPDVNPFKSSFSVKPLITYWLPIAPTRMVFYDDTRIPELQNKFVFGSFNLSELHIVHYDEQKKEITKDEIVELNHKDNVVSLAISPDGSLYHGGYAIYRLDRIDSSSKQQTIFPVEVTASGEVKGPQLYNRENKLSLVIDANNGTYASIKIPKNALDGIVVDDSLSIINDSGDYNTMSVLLSTSEMGDKTITADNMVSWFKTYLEPPEHNLINITNSDHPIDGSNSLKISVNSSEGLSTIYHDFGATLLQDWSEYDSISFYFKGANTKKIITFSLLDEFWINSGKYEIIDDSSEWKKIEIPLKSVYPSPDLSRVRGIEMTFHAPVAADYYVDKIELFSSTLKHLDILGTTTVPELSLHLITLIISFVVLIGIKRSITFIRPGHNL